MKKLSQKMALFFMAFLLTASTAFAAAEIGVDSFVVKGLQAFSGRNLSVYYVSARPATLETPGQIAKVRKILKGPLTFKIDPYGEVKVPQVSVPRDGWTNFNHIIFVVHAQSKHSLQNVDGSLPGVLDVEHEVPFKTEYARFLFRKSIEYHAKDFADGSIELY